MDAILKIFFEECDELLPELERGLEKLSSSSHDEETVNAIFRAVHSVKGGAASFELERLVRFAHIFESALDKLRSGEIEADKDILRTFFTATDVLSDLVVEARFSEQTVDDERIDNSRKSLQKIIGGEENIQEEVNETEETPVPTEFSPVQISLDDFQFADTSFEENLDKPEVYTITFQPYADLYSFGDDARNILISLLDLVPEERKDDITVTCDTNNVVPLDEMSKDHPTLQWIIEIPVDIDDVDEQNLQEVFEWVSTSCTFSIVEGKPEQDAEENPPESLETVGTLASTAHQESPAPEKETVTSSTETALSSSIQISDEQHIKKAKDDYHRSFANKKSQAGGSIRVNVDLIGSLMDMVGEMVIGQASLEAELSHSSSANDQELVKRLSALKGLTRDIQSNVMAMRAQPVENVFQRMQRVAREASNLANKEVDLILEGEDTEVDRTLIENLSDPLTHMVRNAVDHGIESPPDRLEKGKRATGTIRLSAWHRSGRILIEIKDDGAGINTEKVYNTAVKRGVIAADAVLSDDEINELIFAPGFSTADKVSDLSGRGVGMDVVKQSISSLGGLIKISSVIGEGTTFTFSLPLTLAVLDGMLIECQGTTMVVPMASVAELISIDIKKDLYTIPDGSHVISIRGQSIPLIYLTKELNLPEKEKKELSSDPENGVEDKEELMILVVENETGSKAALVVDGVKDQAQVVIKNIEKNYRHIDGISAATILGNGSVSLILDVSTLIAGAVKRLDTRTFDRS